jgi:hypothetical protein
MLVNDGLYQRDDSVLRMRPHIHQRTQAGKIVRFISQVGEGLAECVRGRDVDRSAHRLLDKPAEVPSHSYSLGHDYAEGDRSVSASLGCNS